MSEAPAPAYPTADCPTCHRKHGPSLMPGASTRILCDCGKLLRIEKSAVGNTLVVTEQVNPLGVFNPDKPKE